MKKERVFEIMRYLSCTVVITTVSWGSYAIFVDKLNMSVFLSNLLSWLLATSLSFFVNKLWVFQSYTFKKDELIKEFITFFSSRIFSGVIEIGGVPLLEKIRFDKPFYTLAEKIGLSLEFFFTDGIYSKIFSGIIVLILNYIFAKLLVFRNKTNVKE
ncbi:MAG: GtrA family protein [Eubacterium sp.]|nr:GtrA family protein [Eubacterium sp.]